MGSSCAHYQNKLETKKTIFDDSFGENPWGNPKKNKKPRENQQKTIFGDSLGKLYWQNQKNLEKTKKPKNQNFSENVWSEAHVWFFLVLPRFFWFFLVLTLKKLKKLKVFFVFWIKWWLKKCEKPKKLKVFFGFWVFVALVSFWLRNEKPKKTLSFFGFSHFFNHHFIQKTKKNLEFF